MERLFSAFLTLILLPVGFGRIVLPETCRDPLFQCSFEENYFCGMTRPDNDGTHWTLTPDQGYNSLVSVSFGTDLQPEFDIVATLYTPIISFDRKMCVHFAYKSNGYALSELYFGVSNEDGEQAIRFFAGATPWKEFKRKIHLSDSTRNNRFFWKGVGYGLSRDEDLREIISVDSICVSAGSCLDDLSAEEVGLKDDFKNSNQLDVFYQERNDDGDWYYSQGPTPSGETGPPSGQSNDGYIFFESSDPLPNGGSAKIMARYLGIQGPACLKFYYYMYGQHLAQGWLKVYRKDQDHGQVLLFNVTGNDRRQRWSPKEINLHNLSPSSEVIFEAVKGDGHQSDIGLDTISIAPGYCTEPNSDADIIFCEWMRGFYSRCAMEGSTALSCDWIDPMDFSRSTLGAKGRCLRQSDQKFGECLWVDRKLSCSWDVLDDLSVSCRFFEETTVKCRWENEKWSSCDWNVANPDHLKLSLGYCGFSDGHWGYCQADGQNIIGCHFGAPSGDEYSGTCTWRNGTTMRYIEDQSFARTGSGILGIWGVCFKSSGSYSWCNSTSCENVAFKSNPSTTILCRWTTGSWTSVQMSSHGFGDQKWGGMTLHYSGNITGQCYMVHNHTKAICEMSYGRILRCKADDRLWGRCKWENEMLGSCYWNGSSWEDCRILDLNNPEFHSNQLRILNSRLTGVCSSSNGYWSNCHTTDNSLGNCFVGSTLRKEQSVEVACNWQNGELLTCQLIWEYDYLDCSRTAPSGSWGICSASNGSWAWCKSGADCFFDRTIYTDGSLTRMFCSNGDKWSNCLWSKHGWVKCSGSTLDGLAHCATDHGQWTRCRWEDGFNIECDLATGRNTVSTDAICHSKDETSYCRWAGNATYLTDCTNHMQTSWAGLTSKCSMQPGHWATCNHVSKNDVSCVYGSCVNAYECHAGMHCGSEYDGWRMCFRNNGSYGWCPVDQSDDHCIIWTPPEGPRMETTSMMCKVDSTIWASCSRVDGKCCDCVFTSSAGVLTTQETTLRSLQCHTKDGDVGICNWDRDNPQQCHWRSQGYKNALHCELPDGALSKCRDYSADLLTWSGCVFMDRYSSVVDNRFVDGTTGHCYVTNGTWGYCSTYGSSMRCQDWSSPSQDEIRCTWGKHRYTNCTQNDHRWFCVGSVTLPTEEGFCFTSDWKWGFCSNQLECTWDQMGHNKRVEMLADDMLEMRIHPAILFTTPTRPGKVWCTILEPTLAGANFSLQWYFPNNSRIAEDSSRQFICRESGQIMTSLFISSTDPSYTGTYECHALSKNRVLVSRTLIVVKGCASDQLKCSSDESCVPRGWMCDGTPDCEDYSDEVNC